MSVGAESDRWEQVADVTATPTPLPRAVHRTVLLFVEVAAALDAIVTRVGPTLEEVRAELAEQHGSAPAFHELVDDVRDALRDEAAELVEDADMQIVSAPRPEVVTPSVADEPEERAPVVVRHRFERRPEQRPRASRIVTLRDRRRGRPPKGGAGHGGDPPR